MGTDAERGHDRNLQLRELDHGRKIEMVVVIVRQDDRVQRREPSDRDGNRLEPLWPRERNRGGPLAPDGIGQDGNTVDFEEHGRVPEPGGAKPRLGWSPPRLQRVHGGQGRGWSSPLPAEEILAHRARRGPLSEAWPDAGGVAKCAVYETRRRLDAFEASPVRPTSERRHITNLATGPPIRKAPATAALPRDRCVHLVSPAW
jgi:hypothetical protein